ncbi:putative C6 transcription factor [Aspergillus alliaceus]|uniref:putative C6 transcription factor n=1 Tax=Petromyces alliaceus TaxID=209559 RepID=UPI0012A4EBBC|nr:C6 zinc finger domain protein [Aspergillus alliaceus]KAB8239100.1 C6 zinc finger domain protein [Aspergillus alliaceus]
MSSTSTSQSRRATRSSLACLPCRSRHLKCDGKRPCCARCTDAGKQCNYAPSRRGGLDRAALAERRKRLTATDGSGSTSSIDGSSPQRPVTIGQVHERADTAMSGNGTSNIPVTVSSVAGIINIEDDAMVDAYYKNFHKSHPFILPRTHLARRCQDLGRQSGFTPLIAVLRLIGDIYTSKCWSIPLQEYTETCFAQAVPSDPIMVQCRLLYSMALFWHDQKADAKKEMDNATNLAIDLQMFRQEFAASRGANDPVLRESWRRTWWMLFIVDAYYAGTLGTMNFAVVDIAATVELPCEESEYESGNIPEPKTMEEFNCREFSPESTTFSSFAYLIGAVQCAASAISVAPKIAAKEDSTHVIQAADCSLDGWRLLLPKNSKQVMTNTGDIDELMFQAHLVIHVATIGLHRPFSTLKFNAIEDVSSCAREPPLDTPTPDLVNVHTVRVLRSVEAQIRLLALPVQEFCHTPFTTCMVSEGTLALLSACKFLFKGKDLAIARDQIRMTIGCLRVLGEVWPRTARNVGELQTIGQYVLGVGSRVECNSDASNSTQGLHTFGEGDGSLGSSTDVLSNDTDILSSLDSIQDLCGWYNLGDLNDLPWGVGDGS